MFILSLLGNTTTTCLVTLDDLFAAEQAEIEHLYKLSSQKTAAAKQVNDCQKELQALRPMTDMAKQAKIAKASLVISFALRRVPDERFVHVCGSPRDDCLPPPALRRHACPGATSATPWLRHSHAAHPPSKLVPLVLHLKRI